MTGRSDNPADSLRRELEALKVDMMEAAKSAPVFYSAVDACYPVVERFVTAALVAARADGEKLGRNNAARDIEAHRAKWAPMDGNMDQRRLSRHLGIAARVAQGPIDIEDVRVALERAVSDGN